MQLVHAKCNHSSDLSILTASELQRHSHYLMFASMAGVTMLASLWIIMTLLTTTTARDSHVPKCAGPRKARLSQDARGPPCTCPWQYVSSTCRHGGATTAWCLLSKICTTSVSHSLRSDSNLVFASVSGLTMINGGSYHLVFAWKGCHGFFLCQLLARDWNHHVFTSTGVMISFLCRPEPSRVHRDWCHVGMRSLHIRKACLSML